MSIRVKLILTYAILLIVSALVLAVSGVAIFTGLFVSTAEAVFVEDEPNIVITQFIDLLAELKQQDEYQPERLVSEDYIEEITHSTAFYNGGLIVEHDGLFYNFNDDLSKSERLYEQLMPTGSFNDHDRADVKGENLVKLDDQRYFYIDYTFNGATDPVTYYFLVDISNTAFIKSEGGMQFFSAILVIMVILMVPLLMIITKDIIKPIKQLEKGVKHIKNGDLAFKLETNRNNEIGEVIRYFDVMRQELKASIEKQIQFEENRKELISSISHDLKTPITSIKGHVEGIRDGVANTPEKLDKYLNVIYQKSRDMDQLIDDLFLFSKLDLNRLPFEMSSQSVSSFITELVNEMKLGWTSENRSIRLHLSLNSEEDFITIDVQKIRRVFVNIISNAMKYMDKDQEQIDIYVNELEASYQFVIKDNGMGIPADQVPFIFERFYRVDESRNADTGGTGLGLAISKQIIEQHGGTIMASSQLGEGTKIVIELSKTNRGMDEADFDY